MGYVEGARCPGGPTEHPRCPFDLFGGQMPNANVRFVAALGFMHVRAGSGTVRADPLGKWL
ncbi:MAG: hypothetical protein ACP5VR_05665 [Acidimicrobiales bacterium]